MGARPEAEINAWLRNGGLVVTASDRAARAVEAAFDRARQAEGLSAWPSPNVQDWKSFVRFAWETRGMDSAAGEGRLLLNPAQEQSLWAAIAGEGEHLATLLEGPRHRLAGLAMEAHELLCSYAPQFLSNTARSAWQQDAAAFSGWLAAFDEACHAQNLLSPARLPLEMIPLLEGNAEKGGKASEFLEAQPSGAKAHVDIAAFTARLKSCPDTKPGFTADGHGQRPPLLLVGFDRILPVQRALFDAWGEWRVAEPGEPAARTRFHEAQAELDEPAAQTRFHEAPDAQAESGEPAAQTRFHEAQAEPGEPAAQTRFHEAPDAQAEPGEPAARTRFHEALDAQAELDACARWCAGRLAANPRARLLIVSQDAASRRGQMERAFLKWTESKRTGPAPSPFFEFSLGIPLSRVALAKAAHLLLRWLTGSLAEHEIDWLFSTGHAAASPQESSALQAQVRALRRRGLEQPHWTLGALIGASTVNPPPAAWATRMAEAQRRLADFARRSQSLLDWAELVPRLLACAGWPGARPLSSAEFQAARRWQQAVETCGSLGFDGRRVPWQEFLSILSRALDETLFAPESRDAPIQIAGPAESAGLTADAVWFLGANEDAWPAGGATHPFLPCEVQREAGMPHASPQLDWDLAHAITTRLLASAAEVNFSYAKQIEAADARSSRLIAQFAGPPLPLPPELTVPPSPPPLTLLFQDAGRIPFPHNKVEGGAGVLTMQSQCPFKAFATVRLAAQSWDPAQAGLTASQRGQLLHAVLHAVWGGPPDGIRTLDELKNLPSPRSFVAAHVRRVLQTEIRPSLRERLPRRYLELEELRLTRLLTEWLEYEAARLGFEVSETEAMRTVDPAGLTMTLRLDRIDRLNDGSLLVIDYKTGQVSPGSWNLPRPDDVQLPLYAGFALDSEEALGGLVFAKVRAGNLAFAGRVGDAAATLFTGLKGNSALVKNSLSVEQLMDWREYIEQLAKDFLAGRTQVDPRDYPKTCERCGLQTLCRIQESKPQLESADDSGSDEEAGDE